MDKEISIDEFLDNSKPVLLLLPTIKLVNLIIGYNVDSFINLI